MAGSLQLPAEWVFLLKGAPVGKKAEGKRFVRDLGETITIRDKSARSAPPPVGKPAQVVQIEGGAMIGSEIRLRIPITPPIPSRGPHRLTLRRRCWQA